MVDTGGKFATGGINNTSSTSDKICRRCAVSLIPMTISHRCIFSLPPVLLTPLANLPPVSLIPVRLHLRISLQILEKIRKKLP